MNRTSLCIVGASGSGLLSVGKIICEGLKNRGYFLNADREYPSLIQGGMSSFTINFSNKPIYALEEQVDILVSIDKKSIQKFFSKLKNGGIWVHGYERLDGIKDLYAEAKKRKIKIVHIPIRETAHEMGGTSLMKNVVLIGMTWKVLGFDFANIKQEVEIKFGKKPKLLPINIKCLEAGFERVESLAKELGIPTAKPGKNDERILINGNHALALGAIHCGVRAYFAYPMSPSSSILTHMAQYAKDTGMIVKQAEDEITVANMTVGASHAGTRAMCATSGGGFDLMTETVSLTGITETPFVCCIVQRPGPGTGLPTWTAQGDVNLAVYGGHGECARVVLSVGDATDAFDLVQHAHNLAEEYQIPVIILNEKVIAETLFTTPKFTQEKILIKRGLTDPKLEKVTSYDRFKLTKSGVSKRWIPGSDPEAYYFANGDEHDGMGRLTEKAEPSKAMIEKRIKKLETIKQNLPDPIEFKAKKKGKKSIAFVGFGSNKNIMRDIITHAATEGIHVTYLHYEYLWPFKNKPFEDFLADNPNIHLIENNYTGQFGGIIEQHADYRTKKLFKNKLLKWNGRPFFVEEVMEYVRKHCK